MKYIYNFTLPTVIKLSFYNITNKTTKFTLLQKKGIISKKFMYLPSILKFSKKKLLLNCFYSLTTFSFKNLSLIYLFIKMCQNELQNINKISQLFLNISGFGFRTFLSKSKKVLGLKLGYSHKIYIKLNKLQTILKKTRYSLQLLNISKHLNKQLAVQIRKYKMPDAYKGKGIHFLGDSLKLKVSKKTQER